MMCCSYPTTTVAIDDDLDFLGMVTKHLGIQDYISYSSPNKAIDMLKKQNTFQRIQTRVLKTSTMPDDTQSADEDVAFHVNMRALHEEIYSKDRFLDVSVLVVDYYMDETSGIEVCEKLSKHPAKKILLTGGTDKEKIAIEAFNRGIIHRFINKSDPNFITQLKQAITLLKEAYFRDLTSTIFPYVPQNNARLLQNPAYINFVKNLQDQFNSIEYYLLDNTGSSLFLNEEGIPMWLVVKHESEIDNYVNIAQEQDANENLIAALNKREMMPFFFTTEDYQYPVSKWDNYLYSSHAFPGVNNYYYAIINGHVRNNLIQEHVVSYACRK